MDALRRQKLRHLLDTRFAGDRGRLLKASGMSKGRLSQLLDDTERFGETAARNLEERLALDPGYFDSMDPRTLAWATAFDALPEHVKLRWEEIASMLAPKPPQ
jgi:hypothetical protein